jgi:hypothetical protein
VGPKIRRPKPGTAKAAAVRDEGDPAKSARAALLKRHRDDRERTGSLSTRVVISHRAGPHRRFFDGAVTSRRYADQRPRLAWR